MFIAIASLVEPVGWLLVHSVWQFALIAAVLAVVLRVMRRASAEARYAAALAGWGLMLAAPVATWLVLPAPEVAAPIAPLAAAAENTRPADGPREPLETAVVDSLAVSPVEPPLTSISPPAPVAHVSIDPPTWAETLATRIAPWLKSLVAVWCIGMCAFGAWSAAGWFGVRRLLRRDVVSVPDQMTTLLVTVLKRVGLNQRVRLLQSPHIEVPLVVGWLRPVILLPVSVVTGFPPAQLEAILAHELAHVRRHDYVINLLQLLSETVFFYHPALWWVSGVVRREREHCCDELAAAALGNRAEYGRALVALEELRGRTPSLALGANGGSLLERIQRLAQREPSPRWSAEGVVEVAVIVAVVLTAAAWTAVDAGGDADADSPAVVKAESGGDRNAATFSFGGRVEVMALGTHDEEPQQWWDAHGKVLESTPFEWSSASKLTVTPKFGYRRVVFQVHDLPEDAHVQWKSSGSALAMGGRVTLSDGTTPRNVFTRYFSVDQSGETFDLRVGVATGPWKSVISMTGAGAKTVNGVNLLLSAPVETESETSVVATHNVLDRDYRMVAIDTEGQVHGQIGYGGYSSNGVVHATARFTNLKRKEIKRFEFQLREYEWVTIEDLPLKTAALAAAETPVQEVADAVARKPMPIGPLTEVSVADQVSKYAFEANIPAEHYLWITPTEVPQRRGYSQANIRLRKKESGTQRVELEFKYRDDQRGTAANPLLSTSDTILYGWSAPGCDRPSGTSIVGVPMFNTLTEDKKIVLVDPASDIANSERGTRLLLIIPKDANPQTRAEVEAIQPRGEIVVLLEKIEPRTERPADQRLLGLWHAQRNAIGTSYIKYRRFRQGAGVLKALSPAQVAELFAPEGQRLTSEQAIAAAGGLLEKPESKLFGPDNGTSTFRSVGNKSLETSVRLGQTGDARYIDGEFDIRWDAGNRQAHLDQPGKSGYGWTTLQDFNLADQLASLRELNVTPITDQLLRVKSGPIDLVVDVSGFVYSWQANLPERKFAKSTFQFEPQVPAGDVILPRLRMNFDFRDDELQFADIVLIDEARVNEGFQPEDFALPLPAGAFFFDHRSEPERPRGRKVEEPVDDAAEFVRRTFDAKVVSKDTAGDKTPEAAANAESTKAQPDDRVQFTLIQAKHVLLLDGQQIVTWPEVDAKIAALPDPARAYPQLYVTRGAMEAGLADAAQKEVYELHRKYKLGGHSVGSLTPRTDVRYDRIATAADLVPDPALRVEGTVVDAEGQPVAGAEVVLVTPVDDSLSYKEYDIAIVEGRVRNPVDEVLTVADAEGKFAVYSPKDTPFSVLALHPDVGIALVDGEQLRKEPKATLLKWGGIVAEFSQEPEEQSATLYTHLDATPTRPRISIAQYWVDLQRPEKTLVFGFTRVPPIWQTTIMRSFASDNGGMSSIPGAAVGPLPGETRSLSLGPVSEQQRAVLKRIGGR